MKEDIKELEESLIGMGEDIIEIKKTLVRLDTLVSERNIQAEKFRDDINATLNKMTKFCIDRQLDKSKLLVGNNRGVFNPDIVLRYGLGKGTEPSRNQHREITPFGE